MARLTEREGLWWAASLGFIPKTSEEIDDFLRRNNLQVARPYGAKIPGKDRLEAALFRDGKGRYVMDAERSLREAAPGSGPERDGDGGGRANAERAG